MDCQPGRRAVGPAGGHEQPTRGVGQRLDQPGDAEDQEQRHGRDPLRAQGQQQGDRNPEEGRRRLEELRQLTRGALSEMRTLLVELRPAALVDTDLHQPIKSDTPRTRSAGRCRRLPDTPTRSCRS